MSEYRPLVKLDMDKGFLKYENSKVHYIRFGNGDRLLIALHGFADEAALFLELKESLENHYTVYCLDLPYHGQTIWQKLQFDPADISALFDLILKKESKDRFDLMGYSMGGRIVQKMLFKRILEVDKVYLIAPDGLETKWIFNVNLMPRGIKTFLRYVLKKPDWFIRLLGGLKRVGLITKFVHNFVLYHISSTRKRERIFNTWNSIGKFRLWPPGVKRLLKEHQLSVELFFGSQDEIIPVSAAKRLNTNMPNIRTHIIEEGHLLVDHKLNQLLKEILSEKQITKID